MWYLRSILELSCTSVDPFTCWHWTFWYSQHTSFLHSTCRSTTYEQVQLALWLTRILLSEAVKHEDTNHLSFCHYVVWCLLLVSGVVLIYTGVISLCLDPLWGLGLDRQEVVCCKSKWVNPDTTTFFSFVRDVSSLKGNYYY